MSDKTRTLDFACIIYLISFYKK